MSEKKSLPECWGHRGASAKFPENTLASFEAAIRDGAEGIESDVHVSKDGVVVMFHDPALGRTTDGAGNIKELNWHGEIENVRTRKEPRQAIPTFQQTVDLLMKPENSHVLFNVDVKPENDPELLFSNLASVISTQPDWERSLAPRILLGLWHPRFLKAAKTLLPNCRRACITYSPSIARKYFWDDCDTFSVNFGTLTMADGQKFIADCKAAGKQVTVWTVNDPAHMMEAVRWGVKAILTDTTQTWLSMRDKLQSNYESTNAQYSRTFLWTTPRFYTPLLLTMELNRRMNLEKVAGSFDDFKPSTAIKA